MSLITSIRKKASLYNKAKRTNKADLWAKYKLCKRQTQRAIRSARWSFLKNKLSESSEQKNSKPLWRYIKSKRQDGNGLISPLKENGQLHSDSRPKAEILNNQFCLVFTSEDATNIPKLPAPPNTETPKFEITVHGVTKLLEGLNGGKAPGPDELPNLILKNAANEISPFLKIILDQSLQTGKLPDDWVEANVAPVFKKGDRHSPANYRPISRTCVCAKLLEHIICKQIMSHFSENKILTPVQHGFRSKHSCESQLLITTDEFIQNFEGKTQTDVVVLDFSKAFDVVPHQRLLHKLDHYGIRGTTLNWIQNFLTNRTQKVVVDGSSSESAREKSGVPQGTVLGPLLFLTYINDLPSTVSSQVRFFADDCLLQMTESQLLITTDKFIQNFEGKTQTDVVVLNFCKAFDVVPHQRLLHKLDHYGIRGTTLNWIQNILTNRTQKVVVDGSSSESARLQTYLRYRTGQIDGGCASTPRNARS